MIAVTGPARWALSVDDWRTHAVDERGDHPSGVYRAECGHMLLRVVTLRERSFGFQCERCATLQLEVVQAALDRAAAALREAAQSEQPHDDKDKEGDPDYHCPGCNTLSGLIKGPTQAFCTNETGCRVLWFHPSLPDGGLSQAGVINLTREQHDE